MDEDSASGLSRIADATVIALACTGDSPAFGELVRRRQIRVRNFMYYLCRNPAEGDDLAQQVFLKAWQSLHQLRSIAAFDGWLKKIMVTTWLEAVRRKRIVFEDESEQERREPAYTPSTAKMDLDGALAQLPPGIRLCIVLAYDDGMTHEEIAAMTGIPLGTVKSNILRGSARIRNILFDYRARSEV